MLQNTSQGHKAHANPTCDPGTKYNSTNYKSTTSYDQNIKPGLQLSPTPVNSPHPAYHRHSTLPPHQLIAAPHSLCIIALHALPLHAIPYTPSPSSTPIQSLHGPQTSALAPQTHYPTFPCIVIPPQSHTPHVNTQDGYQ